MSCRRCTAARAETPALRAVLNEIIQVEPTIVSLRSLIKPLSSSFSSKVLHPF